MPGLYVHIPFCARRCPYCDFAIHVDTRGGIVGDYVAMLRRELASTLAAYNAEGAQAEGAQQPLTSIYFGGGTPTALGATQLTDLMAVIHEHMTVAPGAEITVEANPDGLDEAKLAALRAAGWNRVSLGAQSFDAAALQRLGRTHTGAQIEAAVAVARRAGFDNLSLDLIFAVPGQSRASWCATLERATQLAPEHISCYALTIEPGTAFAARVGRGRLTPVEEETQADLMEDARRLLQDAGLARYEVSNYAHPGAESRHNLNYWRGGDYLACGCGAHGHRAGHRWWNERATPRYIELMRERGSARVGEETLSPQERLTEIVMLGLRLREGFSLDDTSRQLHLDARRELNGRLRSLQASGLLTEENGRVRLTPASMPVADAVAAQLILRHS